MIQQTLLLALLVGDLAPEEAAPVQGLAAETSPERSALEWLALARQTEARGEAVTPTLRYALRDAVAGETAERLLDLRALSTQARRLGATTQLAVVEGLSRSGATEAVPILVELIGSTPGIEVFVLEGVEDLARTLAGPFGSTTLSTVRHALEASESEVQAAAARAAGALRDDDAVGILIAMLQADELAVRNAAHSALQELSGFGFPAAPSLWERWYSEELAFLEEKFQEQVAALNGKDRARRIQAVKAIVAGRLGRVERATALMEVLPLTRDEDLALHVVSGLRILGVRLALPTLRDVADEHLSQRVRAAAQAAIAAMEGKGASGRSRRRLGR